MHLQEEPLTALTRRQAVSAHQTFTQEAGKPALCIVFVSLATANYSFQRHVCQAAPLVYFAHQAAKSLIWSVCAYDSV